MHTEAWKGGDRWSTLNTLRQKQSKRQSLHFHSQAPPSPPPPLSPHPSAATAGGRLVVPFFSLQIEAHYLKDIDKLEAEGGAGGRSYKNDGRGWWE